MGILAAPRLRGAAAPTECKRVSPPRDRRGLHAPCRQENRSGLHVGVLVEVHRTRRPSSLRVVPSFPKLDTKFRQFFTPALIFPSRQNLLRGPIINAHTGLKAPAPAPPLPSHPPTKPALQSRRHVGLLELHQSRQPCAHTGPKRPRKKSHSAGHTLLPPECD